MAKKKINRKNEEPLNKIEPFEPIIEQNGSISFFRERKNLYVSIGLAIVCLIIYGQTIGFGFINIDDRLYVYENRAVLSGFNTNSIYWAFTAFHSGNWHPLTWLSHILDFTLFGLNPSGHHAVNIVFHIINSILAFAVFRRLTGDFVKSAIVAFLFAVHPAHVESVAWIAERKDVLSTMFWLLTMLFYLKFVGSSKNDNRRNRFYWLMLACFVLGLMSKAMLVTLPFVLLLCDFWSLERLKKLSDLKPLIIEKLPLFAIMIVSVIVTFTSQKIGSAVATLENVPLETRLLNVALSYAKYVVMMFYPANLAFFYPFESKFETWQIVGSIILLISITIFCLINLTKRKYLAQGWFWFLGTFVPVIGFVQIGGQSLADRYTYVPYFGLFVMIVWGFGELFEKFKVDKKAFAAIWAIIILTFGGLAFQQTTYWKNSETLYTRSLELTENNYFLMSNLCLHYINNTKPEIAEPKCTELLGKTPPNPEAFNYLGMLRTQVGKYDEAVKNFQAASQLNPDWGIPVANAAIPLAIQGNLAEAEKTWQKSFTMKDVETSKGILAISANAIGAEYLKRGQTEKAIFYLTKATELQPNFPEAQSNLRKAQQSK